MLMRNQTLTCRFRKPHICALLAIGNSVVGRLSSSSNMNYLSFTLTPSHVSWSMIITCYQVQIMRGASPKSYVGDVRGRVDFSRPGRDYPFRNSPDRWPMTELSSGSVPLASFGDRLEASLVGYSSWCGILLISDAFHLRIVEVSWDQDAESSMD